MLRLSGQQFAHISHDSVINFVTAAHWLVDRRGYGVTLATVNILGVLCCIFQVREPANLSLLCT